MKKGLLLITLYCFALTAFSQHLVSATFINTLGKTELDSAINNNGIPAAIVGTQFGVDIYKVVYNTVSYDSTPTIASGLVVFPSGLNCRLPLVSYQHSPESRKNRVPSRLAGPEPLIVLALGSNGYVSCAPDYLGLGDSPGFHPFLHAQSEATAVIDLLRAARELSDSLDVLLNGEIFLSGYSQGGHAAVAAHKMIQQKLTGEMQVTATYAMSGPYDMSGVMFNTMFTDTAYPAKPLVANLFYSYNKIYNLYDTLSKPLQAPFDSVLPPIFNGTQSLWSAGGYINGPATSIFKPDTLAAFLSDTNHPFRRALKDNDVNNWAPNTIAKLIYCSGDSYVPFENALNSFYKMFALGSTTLDTQNVSLMLNHEDCSQFAILAAKQAIDQVSTIDCSTGLEDPGLTAVTIKPNPASNVIHLYPLPAAGYIVHVLSLDGRLMLTQNALQDGIDISRLNNGVYVLQLTHNDGSTFTTRFVKCNN